MGQTFHAVSNNISQAFITTNEAPCQSREARDPVIFEHTQHSRDTADARSDLSSPAIEPLHTCLLHSRSNLPLHRLRATRRGTGQGQGQGQGEREVVKANPTHF